MDLAVDGLVFDLDDTLFDFRGAFAGVVGDFYEQHVSSVTSATRADAVAMMIRWDEELHAVTQYVPDLKAQRFARWLSEWPAISLDMAALTKWYDDGMRTAWVRRGREFPDDLQPPDRAIDSVHEVRHML